jgi:ubiquinol-cytochrome c reductase iron-sulfur subunit
LLFALLMYGSVLAKGIFFGEKRTLQGRARTPDLRPVVSALARPHPGRAADLYENVPSDTNLRIRRNLGAALVVLAFACAIAAGVGFLFIFWTGGGNMLLGGTLGLCLAGFGAALILTSHWLVEAKQAVEPREELPSSPMERKETLEDFCTGNRDVQRRSMLKWMAAGGTGLFGAMIVSLFSSFGMTDPDKALLTTVWKRGQRLMTSGGKPISINSLEPGSSITVFPENSIGSVTAQTVLVRVKPQFLALPADRAGWAPGGYIAYSRVCTHAGCPVGLYESQTHLLLCPCHQSTFDVLRAATPTGGPAARPLPQLPLYADKDGTLRAGGGFTEPPGPGFWGMP